MNTKKNNLKIEIAGMTISEKESFPKNPHNVNNIDIFHMYTGIGENCIISYRHFAHEDQDYIIIANPKTGKRILVEFTDEGDDDAPTKS